MDLKKYEFIKRRNFGFFYVSQDYVDFLRELDNNVCDNKGSSRPYIGIVLEVNNNKYLAPLTSPYHYNEKGEKNKKEYLNNKKYKRIVHPINDEEFGWVRVGNMIPVYRDVIEPIIIAELSDEKLKNRLIEQWNYFKNLDVVKVIENQANELYSKRYDNDNYYLADIVCDYKLLEEKCCEYKKIIDKDTETLYDEVRNIQFDIDNIKLATKENNDKEL